MAFGYKDLGINVAREGFDFCPTASASITGDAVGTNEFDFETLRAQMREALSKSAPTPHAR